MQKFVTKLEELGFASYKEFLDEKCIKKLNSILSQEGYKSLAIIIDHNLLNVNIINKILVKKNINAKKQ